MRCAAGDPRTDTVVGDTASVEYVGQVPAPPLGRYIDDIYCLNGLPRHRVLHLRFRVPR